MARNHARIYTSIWNDETFRNLGPDAQHLYLTLVSQPALSYAGVIDYLPKRLAVLAAGNTPKRVTDAATRLSRSKLIVIDKSTDELLVRSYVRHDGVLDRTNMGKAAARAIDTVTSLSIKQAVIVELGRLHHEHPNLPGWLGIKEISPDVMERVIAESHGMPLPI